MLSLTSDRKVTLLGLLPWIKTGWFAVLDQGLFAGVNFLLNLLLARWLEPSQYGAMVTAYWGIFFLLASFHTAVLTEPMLVFGAGKYTDKFQKYLGILLVGHWATAGVIAIMLALAALALWLWGASDMSQVMLTLALSSPFMLLLWLLRRAFYVRVQPQWAAAGGALYLALMLAGMCGLYWGCWLSAASVLMLMGLASLAVSLWLATILRPQWSFAESTPTPVVVLADHWKYGRWSAFAVPIVWFPSNIYFVVLPIWAGLEGAAVLGASMIFVMPMLNLFQAVSNLLFPVLAGQASSDTPAQFHFIVRRVLKAFIMATAMYFLLFLIFCPWILDWLYQEKYQNYTNVFRIMGMSSFAFAINFTLGTALRVIPLLKQIIWCYIMSSFVTLTLGFFLMIYYGVIGSSIGFVISISTTSIFLSIAYRYYKLEKYNYRLSSEMAV